MSRFRDTRLVSVKHGRIGNVHLEMRNLDQTELQRLKNKERKAEDKTRKAKGRPRETAPGLSQNNELERKL